MDFLLILYFLILGILFVSPFFYYNFREKELLAIKGENVFLPLFEKRNFLLENLKDLKYEYQTGKSSPEEFDELSSSVISDLKQLDEVIGSKESSVPKKKILLDSKLYCNYCKMEFHLESAKFCPNCGKKLVN